VNRTIGAPEAAKTCATRRGAQVFTPEYARHTLSKRLETLLFHPERCTGCGLCRSVCGGRESGFAAPEAARIQHVPNPMTGGSFAVFCQHCLLPRCLEACPQGAVFRTETGRVAIDTSRCVNCGICQEACTQAAPLRAPAGDIRKCDLCSGDPACARICPQQALEFTQGKRLRWLAWLRRPVQALSFLLLVVVLVGSVCSLSIAAFDIACPTGVLQNIFSSKVLLLTSATSALVLIALTSLVGRAFCGWICPFGFLLDLADKVLPQKWRLPAVLTRRTNKYGVLLGAMAASAATGSQAFCILCPIGTVCRSYGVQSALAGAELALVPMIAAMDLGGKRSWCRSFFFFCALFALFARFSLARIEIGAARCKKFSCKRCAEICPMGIVSGEDLQNGKKPNISMAECIFCLRCVDICPHKAAKIRLGLPPRAGYTSCALQPVNAQAMSPARQAPAGERP
jgi:Fe-S-cluster-containing dehydrogenase component